MSRTSLEMLREMTELYRAQKTGTVTADEYRKLQNLMAVAEAEDAALVSGQRPSGSVVHRAIRNYLVNELKLDLTRVTEIVVGVARDRVTSWLDSQVTHDGRAGFRVSTWLSNLVRAAVREHVAEEVRRALAKATVAVDVKL